MPDPKGRELTAIGKVLLGVLLSVLSVTVAMGTLVYQGLASDVAKNEKRTEVNREAINEIKVYQAEDRAAQKAQTQLLEQILDATRARNDSGGSQGGSDGN